MPSGPRQGKKRTGKRCIRNAVKYYFSNGKKVMTHGSQDQNTKINLQLFTNEKIYPNEIEDSNKYSSIEIYSY